MAKRPQNENQIRKLAPLDLLRLTGDVIFNGEIGLPAMLRPLAATSPQSFA